jgi:hypothetical protein
MSPRRCATPRRTDCETSRRLTSWCVDYNSMNLEDVWFEGQGWVSRPKFYRRITRPVHFQPYCVLDPPSVVSSESPSPIHASSVSCTGFNRPPYSAALQMKVAISWKHRWPCTKLHGVTSKGAVLYMVTVSVFL